MLLKGGRCSHFTDEGGKNPSGDITWLVIPQPFSGKGRLQTQCIHHLFPGTELPLLQQLKTAHICYFVDSGTT